MPQAGVFIPINGFTPSVDPTTPGAILDCSNLVPTIRGLKAAPAPVPFGNSPFPSAVTGAATAELLSGAFRTFCGTSTDLYEIIAGANTNVSAVAGGYSGGANRWRFVQFGNATVATNGTDTLQQSVNSGPFQYIGSAASIAVSPGGSGYTTAPAISFTGGGGTGMAAHATVSGGIVTSIVIDNPGQGYKTAPTVVIGGPGTGAAAIVTLGLVPIANILEVVQGFVFALGTNDGVFGLRPHGWWCSGLYDQTNWTPDQSTQCANGIIIDQPGAITAGRALGTNIIVYKQQSMFYGVYQGPPVIWAFNQISPIIGTPCQECVVAVGARHIFLGTDKQVYEFDGTIPNPIGDVVHDWLVANWSSLYQANVQSYYDQQNSLVYWYFCSTASTGTIDKCLVYNHRTGQFGRADLVIESTVQTISGQITWADMGSLPGVSTWSTLPAVPYNSPFWTQSSPSQGVIDTNHTTQSLIGTSQNSSLTTGWLGDDYNYVDYLGLLPRFSQQPTTCTGTALTQASLGSNTAPQQWTLGPLYDGEMGADFQGRYTQITLQFTGNHELMGITPRMAASGEI